MTDKREQMTIMVKPSIKKRLFHWAVERGCKPCDVLEELVLEGLVDLDGGGGVSNKLGNVQKTNKGFSKIIFTDSYKAQCSLQQSSAISEDDQDIGGSFVWLGIENHDAKILKRDALELGLPLPKGEISGWMEYPIPKEVSLTTRMHLNRKQVKALVKELTQWLKEGDFNE